MEVKRDFLMSSLESSKNQYKGYLPLLENHIEIYKTFIKKFVPVSVSKPEKYIWDFTTRSDVVIKPFNCYICFLEQNNIPIEEINSLRLNLTQNFLSNWKPYREYIYNIYQNDLENPNRLTVGELDSSTLYKSFFNNDIIPSDIYYCHILTLFVIPKGEDFRKGLYNQCIRDLLQDRFTKGLITLVLFNGSEAQWNWCNIEEGTFGIKFTKFSRNKYGNTFKFYLENENANEEKKIEEIPSLNNYTNDTSTISTSNTIGDSYRNKTIKEMESLVSASNTSDNNGGK